MYGVDVHPHLIKALYEKNRGVRLEAQRVLICRPAREHRAHVRRLVRELGSAAHKSRVARVLAGLDAERARESLYALLTDARVENRFAALDGLSSNPRPEDARHVLPLLADPDLGIRKRTCVALGRLKCEEAIPDLISLLRQEQVGLTKDAHWALERISGVRLRRDASLWETWWELRVRLPEE